MNVINKITLQGLKKNKTRTIVTIIGVILSAAMITAVTTLIASMQGYAINYAISDAGDWHAVLHNRDVQDLQALGATAGIEGLAVTQSAGYALLPGSLNDNKPYLHVVRFDQAALSTLPVHLLSGRMPEQADEVLVPETISNNGGVQYRVGDQLTLQLGQRVASDGSVLGQQDAYQNGEEGLTERLVGTETRTFTVVGICNRPAGSVEGYSSPGYTLIATLGSLAAGDTGSLNIYFKAIHPAGIYDLAQKIGVAQQVNNPNDVEFNSELLQFMGLSDSQNFTKVLYSLGAILLALIMVGSVSLIYNSFSISVSERRKQFGLLSGAGATSRQLRHSVFFEALVVGGIGIPLGVLAGIAGIGVTIYFLRDSLASLVSRGGSDVPFTLIVPLLAVVIAVVVALITILISAYIPARRTAKMSAMDVIRQTEDIKLTAKQVKTSRLTRKLFGLEGDFASKNLKRNRRRYRSTVISLFISVVLFVSTVAFSTYLRDSVMNVYENTDYDLEYSLAQSDGLDGTSLAVYQSILALDSVQQGSIVRHLNWQIDLSPEQLSADYYQSKVSQGAITDGQDATIYVYVSSVDSTTFADYARSLGLDPEQLSNPDTPAGIIVDKQHYYDGKQKRYLNGNIFGATKPASLSVSILQGDEKPATMTLKIAAFADTAPFGVIGYSDRDSINLIVDDKLTSAAGFASASSANMYFAAKDATKAEGQIKDILLAAGLPTSQLFNEADALQSNRNLITIISVFSYGFIVLMSLITIANVFNTISTNVNLRRREFAMLKSVGMTERGMKKMLDFECIFYGLKALLYGLPVAVFVTYLIYRGIMQGVETPFYLPVAGILISVVSVFLVVFVSMKFSRDKVRKENILDALKNENL